ncbi:DUF2760 domain-containing protein [Methylococcus capsulatus]|uniref:DUF2760 domain-containing protein n=1 Tax=Methylococcus capsulatus TaxID=414 RepID=UPI0002E870FC
MLLAALGAPALLRAEGEWQPSTLSEATLAKVHEAAKAYQDCLNEAFRTHVGEDVDSRVQTDRILHACENRLTPMKAAFDAERVPDSISERYMRSYRTRGARDLVRLLMSAQAARAAAAESASELSATADTPSPHPYPSEGKPMEIDLNLIPAKLDAVHVGLAAVVVVLLLVQIILLSVAVIALLRRRPEPAVTLQSSPAVSAAEPVKALEPVMKKETVVLKETTPDAALQLLTLLQKEARFIDFVQENIAHYSDAEIGAAARVVHEGCHKVIGQVFDLAPVRSETEGSRLTLPKGFDAASVRLSGNIVGEPPFTGTLVHRGWRVENIRLPKVAEGHDVRILAQAEVEL